MQVVRESTIMRPRALSDYDGRGALNAGRRCKGGGETGYEPSCRYNMVATVSGTARVPLFVLLGTASVEPPAPRTTEGYLLISAYENSPR
ncbi:hypothetical protein NPIL_332691 [Nephila pilipes]|uniref:Uncharacterized protein n=1 Tax=Nephila pilipes TaxID=299642 RepID=A0A8X6JV46_NEPPI|nr:hypothetical protein NPIL_332691 [Nephila pilipes]